MAIWTIKRVPVSKRGYTPDDTFVGIGVKQWACHTNGYIYHVTGPTKRHAETALLAAYPNATIIRPGGRSRADRKGEHVTAYLTPEASEILASMRSQDASIGVSTILSRALVSLGMASMVSRETPVPDLVSKPTKDDSFSGT